ncbi:hypothetical protein Pan241w_37580 [Gimesia alba]|uniref:Uncharacterized protein n=1 Tax=Gimesia alba TaxID=2527973 RepID=A0A517RIE3_9PLAN|nr:outer membrane protein assembly factor BamE [Gimesia alba]QDT43656.1 hypothetical protein Pan241w_37580 [Gimesia alba]
MGEPQRLSEDSDIEIVLPREGSPVSIYVSDRGTTLIRNSADNLIVVSPEGKDVGKIDLLKDAFTETENRQYVHDTTAGPYWSGLSAWYYLDLPQGEIFVVRPWWGRHIFVDVSRGKLARSSQAFEVATLKTEEKLVMSALSSKEEPADHEFSKYGAAYLAGILKLKQAIPLLKSVEKSTDIGSCTFGGLSFGEDYNNEVNPRRYCTYDLRQAAQLSLRRLGITPKHLPCHSFQLEQGDDEIPFVPTDLKRPRHENVERVKVGMSAKHVLNTIGAPDFINYDTWSYDMDADEPFSLTLTFDERKVTATKKEAPLWKSGLSRDEALAY